MHWFRDNGQLEMNQRKLAIALVHYPILDRASATVTTSVTNLDIHDIARSAFTYGLSDYFIVHPVEAQRELVHRITSHWTEGTGKDRIPDREHPMRIVKVVESLEAARNSLGNDTIVWTTSAQVAGDQLEISKARAELKESGPPILLVLGTGWGLAPSVHSTASATLTPIVSPRQDGYNHLSVRAAAAIYVDRLMG